MLGAVRRERGMREELRRADEPGRDRAGASPSRRSPPSRPNAPSTVVDDRGRRRLVERDTERVGVDEPQVHPRGRGGRDDLGRAARNPHRQRVEVVLVHDLDPTRAQRGREPVGESVHAARDRAQTVGTVVRGVQTRR